RGKTPRLSSTKSGHDGAVTDTTGCRIIRRNEYGGRRTGKSLACCDFRHGLRLQPLEGTPLFRPLATCAPGGNESGEHAVRLRWPFRSDAGLTLCGQGNAEQVLDFQKERHDSLSPSSASPPSPSSASSWLRRTIETSLSCGVRRIGSAAS